jgi:hypothetical protein
MLANRRITALQKQVALLEQNQTNHIDALHQRTLDPAVHKQILRLHTELKEAKAKHNECRDDLEAREFTPQR